MKIEIIKEVVVNDKNELLIKVFGDGNPMYQYVYIEAAGVYWDENQKAFKSAPKNEWTTSKWFLHIKDVLKSTLKIELTVDQKVKWNNITDQEINMIKNALQQDV